MEQNPKFEPAIHFFKHIMKITDDNNIQFRIIMSEDGIIKSFNIDSKFFQLRSKIRSKLVRQLKIALDEYQLQLDSLSTTNEASKS